MSKVLFGSSLGFVVLPLLLIAQSPSSGPVYVSFNEHGRVTGEADAEFKSVKRVATFGERSVFMIRRDPGASVPEIHRQMAHMFMVVSGEGTLVLGGELVGRHQDPNSGDRENGNDNSERRRTSSRPRRRVLRSTRNATPVRGAAGQGNDDSHDQRIAGGDIVVAESGTDFQGHSGPNVDLPPRFTAAWCAPRSVGSRQR